MSYDTVGKHLQGEHDQQTHDPTQGEGSDDRAASRRAEGLQEVAGEGPAWLNPDTVDGAIYGAIGAGSAALARHYMRRSPVLATAYGIYALGSLAAGATSLHSGLSKAVQDNPLQLVIDGMVQIAGVDDETLIEDLGEFLIANEIEPNEIDEELIVEFVDETYGLGDVEKADSYADGMDHDITLTGDIAKVDTERRQVFGWASITEYDGEPVVDLQKDYIGTDDLEQAAYDYVLDSRVGGEMHQRVGKSSPKHVATLIESFVVTPEKVEKLGLPPGSLPNGWWIGFQIPKDETGDKVWGDVKKGKYAGFSIHGVGKRLKKSRSQIGKALTDRSPEEYQGWLKRMSEIAGVEPEQIDADLRAFMQEHGLPKPTDEDIHEFLMSAYNQDVGGEIEKHLVGRHKQKDHDPTKGGGHSRSDHRTGTGAAVGGAAAGGLTAAATHSRLSGPLQAAMSTGGRLGPAAAVGGLGALAGGMIGAQMGGSSRDQAVQGAGQPQDQAGMIQQLSAESGIPVQQLMAFSQQTGQDAARMYSDWQKARDRGSVQDAREVGGIMAGQARQTTQQHRQHAQQAQPHEDRKIRKALYVKAAEYADSPEEFWEYVGEVQKHLIGRHDQKKHGNREGHSRQEHDTLSEAAASVGPGAASGALGGGLAGLPFGNPFGGALVGATLGAPLAGLAGAFRGAREGGERAEGRRRRKEDGPSPMEAAMERTGLSEEEVLAEAQRRVGEGEPIMSRDFNALGRDLVEPSEETNPHSDSGYGIPDEMIRAYQEFLQREGRPPRKGDWDRFGKNQPKQPGWETKWYPKRPRKKSVDPNKVYNERRHQRRKLNKRALTDREREVLAKYLGR